jgi:hypothetical protein
MSSAHAQVSHLRRSRIDLNEKRISGARFQHEIKSVEPGKIEALDHSFDSKCHFSILNQAHHGGVSGRTGLVDHLKVEARKNNALPAHDCAGRFVPCDKRLGIDRWTAPQ